MKYKPLIIFIAILLLIIIIFFKFDTPKPTGKSVQVEIVPLSPEEKQIISNVLSSNEFVQDVPSDEPISIRFFSFSNNQRIWHDGFLIGQGEPVIQLIMHSKYISEINNDNLCEVINKANKNGDLGFYSEYSKARLLLKYTGMLKHRKCFGF